MLHPLTQSIVCNEKLIDLSSPIIMGILNATPDSFYIDSRVNQVEQAIATAATMLQEGAGILDIGGVSTRPHAKEVSASEELDRILPIIEAVAAHFPQAIYSIDTYRAVVAEAAVKAGAHIINDISGGTFDENMYATVARLQVPYILMHIQGTPQTMQQNPHYQDIITEMLDYFIEKTAKLHALGVKDVILDPGFGFGKTVAHNYEILRNLHQFKCLGMPILAGLSRKSMIYKTLGNTAETALTGTISANTIALMQGANILRVHDVRAARELISIKKATFPS